MKVLFCGQVLTNKFVVKVISLVILLGFIPFITLASSGVSIQTVSLELESYSPNTDISLKVTRSEPFPASGSVAVILTSSSGGEFRSGNLSGGCSGNYHEIGSANIASNASQKAFCYRNLNLGLDTITAVFTVDEVVEVATFDILIADSNLNNDYQPNSNDFDTEENLDSEPIIDDEDDEIDGSEPEIEVTDEVNDSFEVVNGDEVETETESEAESETEVTNYTDNITETNNESNNDNESNSEPESTDETEAEVVVEDETDINQSNPDDFDTEENLDSEPIIDTENVESSTAEQSESEFEMTDGVSETDSEVNEDTETESEAESETEVTDDTDNTTETNGESTDDSESNTEHEPETEMVPEEGSEEEYETDETGTEKEVLVKGGNLAKVINQPKPIRNKNYFSSKKRFSAINQQVKRLENAKSVLVDINRFKHLFKVDLREGMSGFEVLELQKYLAELGYFSDEITGYYGPVTKSAVIDYQLQNNITSNLGQVTLEMRNNLNRYRQNNQIDIAKQHKQQIKQQLEFISQQIQQIRQMLNSQHAT